MDAKQMKLEAGLISRLLASLSSGGIKRVFSRFPTAGQSLPISFGLWRSPESSVPVVTVACSDIWEHQNLEWSAQPSSLPLLASKTSQTAATVK